MLSHILRRIILDMVSNSPHPVEIENLSVEYFVNNKPRRILSIPELKISKGENILLIGPSGIGKTTLLSVIAGLKRPASGRIIVNATSLSELNGHRLDLFRAKTFGIVFQAFNLIESSPVRRNIQLPLLLTGRSGSAADLWVTTLIEKIGLKERQWMLPPSLSVGERQRVAVARAIAGGAPILLADEPTSNLDKENSEIILQIFKEHLEKGGTLITASHEEEMKSFAERVIDVREFSK